MFNRLYSQPWMDIMFLCLHMDKVVLEKHIQWFLSYSTALLLIISLVLVFFFFFHLILFSSEPIHFLIFVILAWFLVVVLLFYRFGCILLLAHVYLLCLG